jgi:Helicase associated domain
MQEQDAVLADIICEMREERGRRGGFDDSRLRERVEVLGPEVSLEVLRNAVSTAIVDSLGVTWDERYGELKRYKERFDNCDVPRGWTESPQLSQWVKTQRSFARQQSLSAERIRRLNDIGFDFEPYDSAWLDKFEELQAFFSSEGHPMFQVGILIAN